MALSESDHQLLEHFVDGALDPIERAALEERLRNEPELQQGLSHLELAKRALRFTALQEQVQQARSSYATTASKAVTGKKVPWIRYAFAAAAVLLLLWIGNRVAQPAQSAEQLYAQHFVEYAPAQVRGTGDSSNDYSAGRYAKIVADVAKAERYQGVYALAPESFLRGALAAMHLEQWDKALHFLDQLRSPEYAPDAEYYRALVFLRLKRFTEARVLLQKIHDDAHHPYQPQASSAFINSVRKLEE